MPPHLSSEILLEIASYFDPLRLVRDCTLEPDINTFKSSHDALLNLCLVSRRFNDIFGPPAKRVVFQDGQEGGRSAKRLIEKYAVSPTEAASVRGLSVEPADMKAGDSDDTAPRASYAWPADFPEFFNDGTEGIALPGELATLLSLLPNLEILHLRMGPKRFVAHRELMNCLRAAGKSPTWKARLLPSMKTVAICSTARAQDDLPFFTHGYDLMRDLVAIPGLEELNVRWHSSMYPFRGRPKPLRTAPGSSSIKRIHVFDSDASAFYILHIIANTAALEQFTFQWRLMPESLARLNTADMLQTLRRHKTSLRRLTFDASANGMLEKPSNLVLPLGSISDFTALEYLELPMIVLTGRPKVPFHMQYDADELQMEYEYAVERWGRQQPVVTTPGGEAELFYFPRLDWNMLTGGLPANLQTLVLQCPGKAESVPWEWVQHFAMTKLEHMPALRLVDMSSWRPRNLDVLFSNCDGEMLVHLFDVSRCTLKLPSDYRIPDSTAQRNEQMDRC